MDGYVYLIFEESDDLVYKIGITKNEVNEGRLQNLSTGNSNPIRVLYTFKTQYYRKLEKMLHNQFAPFNKKGEWFHLTDEQVINFLPLCTELNKTIKYLSEHNPFY